MTDAEWLDDLAEVPLRAVSESEYQRLFALARKGLTNNVYLVMYNCFDDWEIVGIFSSQEKAEEYIITITDTGKRVNTSWDKYTLDEVEADD